MANVQLTGVIKEIKDSQVFGTFEKREFWITETEGQYPNTFALEAQQGFCNELDKHSIGDTVECSVDVRGRHWSKNEKEGVMNTLKCWKIVSKAAGQSQPQQQPKAQQQAAYQQPASTTTYNDIPYAEPVDDLPF